MFHQTDTEVEFLEGNVCEEEWEVFWRGCNSGDKPLLMDQALTRSPWAPALTQALLNCTGEGQGERERERERDPGTHCLHMPQSSLI